ncbi:hypothetical protein ACE193_15380 [Bernardetia sp. OM2101]|uniref:hypothetical protein n=1 Tax=Bernardetia sp. OM2101 TaxID=3344876 RepID=UPI0035CE9010
MKDPQFHQKLNLWQRIERMYQRELDAVVPKKKPIREKWLTETATKIHSLKSQLYQADNPN